MTATPSGRRSRREAERFANAVELEADVQRGKARDSGDTASWTVAGLMRWWLTNYSAQTLSHSKTAASVEKHLLNGPLSEIRLRDLTSGPIAEFLQEKSKSLAPRTVNHLQKFLVQAFVAAIEAKRWHENPAKETKRRKVPKRKSHNYLSADEVLPVLWALDARWRPLFLVSVCLGLRARTTEERRRPQAEGNHGPEELGE